MNNQYNKTTVAVFAGAVTTIVVWVLNTYFHAAIPDLIQGAINTVITGGLVWLVPNKEA